MKRIILLLTGIIFFIGSLSSCSLHNSIHFVKASPKEEISSTLDQGRSERTEEDLTPKNYFTQTDKLTETDSIFSLSSSTNIIPINPFQSEKNIKSERYVTSNYKVFDKVAPFQKQVEMKKEIEIKNNDAHWSLRLAACLLGSILGVMMGFLVVVGFFLGVYDGSFPDIDNLKGRKDFNSVFKRAFFITYTVFFWIFILAAIALGIYWLYLQYGLLLTLLGVGGIIILFSLIGLWLNNNSDGLMRFLFIGWGH